MLWLSAVAGGSVGEVTFGELGDEEMVNRRYLPWLALGAVVVVAAVALGGVSISPAVYVLIALACPVMMMFMMGNMHGGGGSHGNSDDDTTHLTGSDKH